MESSYVHIWTTDLLPGWGKVRAKQHGVHLSSASGKNEIFVGLILYKLWDQIFNGLGQLLQLKWLGKDVCDIFFGNDSFRGGAVSGHAYYRGVGFDLPGDL